jgi:flagellar basal body-associated protein FliL
MAMPPPPAPQPAPPAGGKKPAIFWIMVLGLGGLFLIAVLLILFFALKH